MAPRHASQKFAHDLSGMRYPQVITPHGLWRGINIFSAIKKDEETAVKSRIFPHTAIKRVTLRQATCVLLKVSMSFVTLSMMAVAFSFATMMLSNVSTICFASVRSACEGGVKLTSWAR